ncbi:MAG: DUF937 domain-containing protein [Dysgonomonas sp.]
MLDSIIDLVKGEALSAITNNDNVPADKRDAAVEATTSGIVDGLKSQFSSGNLSNILDIFGGSGGNTASLTSSIENSVVSALSQKVGLSPSVASSIASVVIPAVVGLISKKHNDSNDSFSLDSVVESFTKNQGGGILGAIKGLFGK